MATCEVCGREMLTADGCKCSHIEVGKRFRKRIPVGFPGDLFYEQYLDVPKDERVKMRCHDCNALYGQYHHPGCDSEGCPQCGGQMITCGCKLGRLAYYEKE